MKYPKIETLFKRNLDTFKVIPSEFCLAEFDQIARWHITEKINGTNVRVMLHPDGKVEIRGRTDHAQFNPVVLNTLTNMFPADLVQSAFEQDDDGNFPNVILYGEGYGEKIQGGGAYRQGQSFRLFDVRVEEWWLNWSNVNDIAAKLNVKTVPYLGELSKHDIEFYRVRGLDVLLKDLFPRYGSVVRKQDGGSNPILAEGIVARTDPLLFTRRGDRVMWKLKHKDIEGQNQ